jgi:mannonate dehydratase
MPIMSVDRLVEMRLLPAQAAPVLKALREHNPLLFDFVQKRHLAYNDRRFPASVFETRGFFTQRRKSAST